MLLHPLGADRHIWRPLTPLLAPHRELVAVDLPGFGDSPPLNSDRPPTPARLGVAVVELLAELGLDAGAAHLAGNSLGGWVALEVAAAGHADTVTAIAPAGLWPEPLRPKPELARQLARHAEPALSALRFEAVRRLALSSMVAHPERVPPTDAIRLVRAYARAPGFTEVNRAMRGGTFTALAKIEVPVTLAWPALDRLVARPARRAPNAREVILPGCGHVPVWDDPPLVADTLLAGSRR